MKTKTIAVFGGCAVCALSGAQVSFTPIGALGVGSSFTSEAFGISYDGQVAVGASQGASGFEPIKWTRSGGLTSLGMPATLGWAQGASSNGSVIAGRDYDSSTGDHAWAWTQATGFTDLGSLPGTSNGVGNGISPDGSTIVGASDGSRVEAFRWTASSGISALGMGSGLATNAFSASSNGSIIVGYDYYSNTGYEPMRWTQATGIVDMGFLPGDNLGMAYGVSSDGSTIVGFSGSHAFSWRAATGMVDLGFVPGSTLGIATAASGDGSVIVGQDRDPSSGNLVAAFWRGGAAYSLSSYLEQNGATGLSGWTLTTAGSVSGNGSTVVGYGIDPAGYREGFVATINPAPEPATIAVLGLSMAALLRKRRR